MEVPRSLITSAGIDNTTINFYYTGNETKNAASVFPHLALPFYVFPCTDQSRNHTCRSKDRLEPGWYPRRHSESHQDLRYVQSRRDGGANQQSDCDLSQWGRVSKRGNVHALERDHFCRDE